MASLELLVKALDTAVWEMGEAFKGLADEDVWKRAHPRLLSVGELAAHVVYWEGRSFLGDAFDSPLNVDPARYYPATRDASFQLDLGAEAVYEEVKRVHDLCKASFAANPKDGGDPNPYREGWTWGFTLEYQVFHVAYHTGQMYSVRHLMGHDTVDN